MKEKTVINDDNFKKIMDIVAGGNLIRLTGSIISTTLNMKNWAISLNWKAHFDTS